jgi:hypothetical protein
MQQDPNRNNEQRNDNKTPATKSRQEQTDPQLTELRGFVDPKEDLEPTLTDGTKAPDKADAENAQHGGRLD